MPIIMPKPSKTGAPAEEAAGKLRQSQAEYVACRPAATALHVSLFSGTKTYVCRRCHGNFRTGEGKSDPRFPGLGKCNACLAVAATAVGPSP